MKNDEKIKKFVDSNKVVGRNKKMLLNSSNVFSLPVMIKTNDSIVDRLKKYFIDNDKRININDNLMLYINDVLITHLKTQLNSKQIDLTIDIESKLDDKLLTVLDKSKNIITNAQVGSFILDLKQYNSDFNTISVNNYIYSIGKLNKTNIHINSFMSWMDNDIFVINKNFFNFEFKINLNLLNEETYNEKVVCLGFIIVDINLDCISRIKVNLPINTI